MWKQHLAFCSYILENILWGLKVITFIWTTKQVFRTLQFGFLSMKWLCSFVISMTVILPLQSLSWICPKPIWRKATKPFISLRDIWKAMRANIISLTILYKHCVPSQFFMIHFLCHIGHRKMSKLKSSLKYSLSNGEQGSNKILQCVNLYYKACWRENLLPQIIV